MDDDDDDDDMMYAFLSYHKVVTSETHESPLPGTDDFLRDCVHGLVL